MQNCHDNVPKSEKLLQKISGNCRKNTKLIETTVAKHVHKFLQNLAKTEKLSHKVGNIYLLAYLLLRHKLILITTSRVKNFI